MEVKRKFSHAIVFPFPEIFNFHVIMVTEAAIHIFKDVAQSKNHASFTTENILKWWILIGQLWNHIVQSIPV